MIKIIEDTMLECRSEVTRHFATRNVFLITFTVPATRQFEARNADFTT
ncbi:hypothetical protein J2T18_000035 [Paenibacillus polymyxa]|nr:hypothetical protein [Paenibacillus polymyxa]